MRLAATALAALAAGAVVDAYYLPGVAPHDYEPHEQVEMWVNKITSTRTQIPYRYYSLPGICKPERIVRTAENLGEIMAGDRIENSDYELRMDVQERCKVLCQRTLSERDAGRLARRIHEEYTVNWIVDNMPGAVKLVSVDDPNDFRLERGFPLGYGQLEGEGQDQRRRFYIFNHIRFVIEIHEDPEKYQGKRIVGFQVEPFSVRHTYDGTFGPQTELHTCNMHKSVDRTMPGQPVMSGETITYTYDVEWRRSDTQWTLRWDVYLESVTSPDIHWFSIVNSLMIVIFLTGMIAMILMRALRHDIARYNEEGSLDDPQEETGWKLVHGDVFRPPQGVFGPMVLSVFVGSGVQVLAMILAVMLFAVLGFLSPANRGSFLTALLLLFVFMGSPAGYVSARLYKLMGGKMWARNTLLTAVVFPGSVFFIMMFINTALWARKSTGAVPFLTAFAILGLWMCVSTPLVFLGAYFGFGKTADATPCSVNKIPRHVPPQPWYLSPVPSVLVGGILPFGAVFIELFFIMSSLWLAQTYYLFGILALVILILIVTCAEISIVMAYFQLCAEDYNWWWRSFLTSGSSAAYLLLYSVLYFTAKLETTEVVSAIVYFGYMLMMSWAFFLFTGCIGFLACLFFVWTIYGAIKVD